MLGKQLFRDGFGIAIELSKTCYICFQNQQKGWKRFVEAHVTLGRKCQNEEYFLVRSLPCLD